MVISLVAIAMLLGCDGHAPEASATPTPIPVESAAMNQPDQTPPPASSPGTPPGGRVPGGEAGFGGGSSPSTTPPEGELPKSPAGLPMLPIEVKGSKFIMELALDEPTRQRGLGGRRSLASDRGMLFVHKTPEIQSFWMKDCFIDIDIVYVDAQGKVTATYRMKKEPPRKPGESIVDYQRRLPGYSSRRSAVLALEFAPGTLDRLDIRMGEQLGLDMAKLRSMVRE